MKNGPVLIIGSGHLAYRLKRLVGAAVGGDEIIHLPAAAFQNRDSDVPAFEAISQVLSGVDLASLRMTYLVDDRDDRNLELVIALVSMKNDLRITAALFNENIAPHLRAAHPNVAILNPARIAAPTFIAALELPVRRSLSYTPAKMADAPRAASSDKLIRILVASFAIVVAAAVTFFHFAEQLSWLDSVYFVVVTVATVGYGDIGLRDSSALSKLFDIALILASTVFIWMIFSLTVDSIIKRRVQLALGRKKYTHRGHVILCGLGRLGYFIAEGLLDRGEKVLIIESDEASPTIDYFRGRGAEVYNGDARLRRVLEDASVVHAKAVYSVINDDYANLEIGLNARSFQPDLRLVLRIFDESMSQKVKENLDIHLTYSMTAIADNHFLATLPK